MLSRGRRAAVAVVVLLFLALIGGRIAAEFAVDLLWYRHLGWEDVFWTQFTANVIVRTIAALIIGAVVFVNLWLVSRTLGALRIRRRYGNIEIAERLPQSYVIGTLLLIAAFSAWWLSGGMGDGIAALAYLRAVSWGVADPVYGRDLSFYVFGYPFWNRVQTLTGVMLFWSLLLSAIAYVATGGVRWQEAGPSVSATARRHLGLLIAGLILVFAWDIWLDRYELLMTGRGVGGALGYTDVYARIPATHAVFVLAILAAAAVAHGAWRGTLRAPAVGIGVLVLGMVVGQGIYPSVLQNLRVDPDEFARELPYIEQNLAFTRQAYGLTALQREPMPYRAGVQPSPERVAEAVAGVPLWDTRPLLQTYRALQALFPYYDFVNVHYDRYGPPGEAEQVAIAVRELDVTRLPDVAQTWQNVHLNYVRGEGAVVSPVAQMTAGGEPRLYVSDLAPPRVAPDAPAGLQLTEPGFYFGELTHGYVVLTPGSQQPAAATDSPRLPLGVPLDATWKKLAFAWAFQSRNLLLSGEVTPDSRIVYRRLVRPRAATIAPFLFFATGERAAGPVPIVNDGRIIWMLDAFTVSSHFPLAPTLRFADRPIRYIRNSVKATVDGLTGEVRYYAVEPEDPILQTYQRIFPGLILPLEDMPVSVQAHLRYPPALLALQAEVLREYHLRDARAFYNREDVWAIPTETYRDRAIVFEPYFATLPLPGETRSEFLLTTPFVASGRQNMTAKLVVRNDPPYYGQQILYEFPRDELIPGPQQIESLIDQDPAISEQLALWKRGGSDVIRGHIVVVPVDSTLVFVEPLYLEAQESAIPQLERVIVASGRRVIMRPTLEGALAALLGEEVEDRARTPRLAAAPDGVPATPTPAATAAPAPAPAADPALGRARLLLDRAEAQLRAGDWAGFGRSWTELREILRTVPGADGGGP